MKEKEKQEAIRLRIDEKLSFNEIISRVNVSKGTLSAWLKDYPLVCKEQVKNRARYVTPKKSRGVQSYLASITDKESFTNKQKGEIAEAAILLRVLTFGMKAFHPLGNGEREDLVVGMEGYNRLARLQIKWTGRNIEKEGLPVIRMQYNVNNSKNAKTYQESDFDFLVGYNFFTDRAYIFSYSEVKHIKKCVTINPEVEEKWSKIKEFLMQS